MLKNKLIAGAVFALALFVTAGIASAAYTFPSKIVTKQQKMDVQSVLNMMTPSPALTVDGVMGAKTIAAVKAFQTSKGLTADGKIGPMTRAALEAFAAGTPATTTTAAALCPNGMTLASNCATAPAAGTTTTTTTVATGNTDGSIIASNSSYVSYGLQIKKGQTADVAAVKLQATSGPVKVSYVDVQFNVRPWLFFSQLALHDSTGKVLATKTLSSIADTTEITVGSLYQVRFDNVNYTVTPGVNPDLAVSASVLAATDKIPSGGQTVISGITDMRTISEIGYSNTVNWAVIGGQGSNTVTLTSTGSVADLFSRISPSSPVTGQQVVSATQTTSNVVLGIFSLKSANNSSTLNTLSVNINVNGTVTNVGTATAGNAFSNYRLFVNGSSISGGSLNENVVTFSNMTLPLAQDTWTDLTIEADVNQGVSGTVTVSLPATVSPVNPVVTDSNYATPTIEPAMPTSNILTLTTNSLNVSNVVASLGSAIVQNNSTVGYNATYGFTLTNSSNNDLFVSSLPNLFATMTGAGTNTFTNVTASPSTVNGDDIATTHVYAIPAGTSRTFSFSASLRNNPGSAAVFSASSINYDISASNVATANTSVVAAGLHLTSGLSGLTLTASF